MKSQNNKVRIMGILNVTPDSFSDGGSYTDVDRALAQAERMAGWGADIIDVGGESTRPGFVRISDEEELERILPVIEAIHDRIDIPISVDTYKYKVAAAAIDAGAAFLNSIYGFKKDEGLAGLVAKTGVDVCLMHNRDEVWEDKKLSTTPSDNDEAYMELVTDELMESVDIARKYGIPDERIILDPGVGFGKSYEQNLCVIRHVDRICKLGFDVMMAASRKSVIGKSLGLDINERDEATIAISVYSAMKGCSMVRVHDVKGNRRALDILKFL